MACIEDDDFVAPVPTRRTKASSACHASVIGLVCRKASLKPASFSSRSMDLASVTALASLPGMLVGIVADHQGTTFGMGRQAGQGGKRKRARAMRRGDFTGQVFAESLGAAHAKLSTAYPELATSRKAVAPGARECLP